MTLKYKGYIGSVEVDMEDGILYGKLLHIRDLINYEAETPAELKAAFEEAVDDYLQECEDQGVNPDVPFKGQFNVRVSASLHRELAISAKSYGKTLNAYVEQILKSHEHMFVPDTVRPQLQQTYILKLGESGSQNIVKVTGPQTQQHRKPTSWFAQGVPQRVN
jgi:predicted HicB family RNase H-like nuclease